MAVRRVRRIIRRVDPWTMLKVSFIFNVIAALAFVLGSVIFWTVFVNAGVPDKFIDLFETLGITLTVDGALYFRVVILLSVIWAVLATGLFTLGAVLYNLIADAVGGLEVVVLEEVLAPQNAQQAGRQVRRPVKPLTTPKPLAAPQPQPSATKPRNPLESTPTADHPTEESSIAR